jgi:hypothetical protein
MIAAAASISARAKPAVVRERVDVEIAARRRALGDNGRFGSGHVDQGPPP